MRRRTILMKSLAVMLLVLLGILSSFGSRNISLVAAQSPVLKIGFIAPLSNNYGQAARNGFDLALEQADFTAGGYKIEPVYQDDMNDFSQAEKGVNNLIGQGVSAIVGSTFSSITIPISTIANNNNVVLITGTASSPEITATNNIRKRYIFRTCYIDEYETLATADFAKNYLNKQTAVVLYPQDDGFYFELANNFKQAFTSAGGQITYWCSISSEGINSDTLSELAASKPDVIVLECSYQQANTVGGQIRSAGINSVFIGNSNWVWEGPINNASTLNAGYMPNFYANDDPRSEVQAFKTAYNKKFGSDPDGTAALFYDSAKLLLQAIETAKSSDATLIRDTLQATRNFSGISGNISYYSSQGDPCKSVIIEQIKNGSLVYITSLEGIGENTTPTELAELTAGSITGGVENPNIEGKKNSNQIAAPFNPTDIFVPVLSDWSHIDVAARVHGTVIGSEHQSLDWQLDDYFNHADVVTKAVDMVHKAGMQYTGRLTPDVGDRDDPGNPNESAAACLDIHGNIVYFGITTEKPRMVKSFHYPPFKEYMVNTGKKAVDCGVDILCIDMWSQQYDCLFSPRNGDFSPNSMEDFRNYLAQKYSSTQLMELGIKDIYSFDYGDYIRKNYLTQYEQGDRWKVPLYQDFQNFQLCSCVQFWQQVCAEVRSYAVSQGRTILFTANADASQINSQMNIGAATDGFMSEYFFGLPPNSKTIPLFKILHSLSEPTALMPNCQSTTLLSRPDISELMKIYTAEAYASGGFMYVPYQDTQCGPDGWGLYSANLEPLYPYYDFIHQNTACYNDLLSSAKVAVLYSYPSIWYFNYCNDSFFGMSNLLLDAHEQYDVIFAGDNNLMKDTLTSGKLNQYNAVILPNVRSLSDSQIALILNYLQSGGVVLAVGETGTSDLSGNPRTRTQLNDLLVEGSHEYGAGQFVYVNDDVGLKYYQNKDASIKQKVCDILDGLNLEDIKTNASDKVVFLEYWNTSLGASIIHLINYDYDINQQHINKQNHINVDVLLDSKLLDKELAVFYASPDWSDIKELNFTITNNKVNFVIPSLETYGVIFIGEKAKSTYQED